ncbi:hypothetical protein ElyMa_002457300 [Elysia marginata]|uniref:Uncharacterized protein n=1 Tax=Elysia marginata TaxID=1093978 RepID=A0AAV4GMC4_9GAST|nr:hypothetical protein ElyMa_002457300 [Elysia marginata]
MLLIQLLDLDFTSDLELLAHNLREDNAEDLWIKAGWEQNDATNTMEKMEVDWSHSKKATIKHHMLGLKMEPPRYHLYKLKPCVPPMVPQGPAKPQGSRATLFQKVSCLSNLARQLWRAASSPARDKSFSETFQSIKTSLRHHPNRHRIESSGRVRNCRTYRSTGAVVGRLDGDDQAMVIDPENDRTFAPGPVSACLHGCPVQLSPWHH